MTHTRVRLSPDDRREQLLDLGIELLATRSLDELSIDLLAEEAGISRGLLYHYFRNKQEFHRAVVRRATDEMLELTTPDPSLDALTRLTTGLAAYIDYVEGNFEPFTSLVRGAASGDRFLREIYEDARGAITGRIFDSVGELGLSDSPATRLLVNGWAAMVEEAVITWVQERQVPKEELLRLLAAALPAVLAATVSGHGPQTGRPAAP
jgi:AcrR family transcriptional regulator